MPAQPIIVEGDLKGLGTLGVIPLTGDPATDLTLARFHGGTHLAVAGVLGYGAKRMWDQNRTGWSLLLGTFAAAMLGTGASLLFTGSDYVSEWYLKERSS